MSIDWTNTIPTDPRGKPFPLHRTPPTGKLVAAITSEDLTGCDTHFFGGHTVPHHNEGCEPCEKGMPFRWHGYVSAVNVTTRLHFIFEFTAQAADTFDTYRKAHGTLRGCLFEARRLHAKPNGRVMLQCKPLDQQKLHLPEPPSIPDCMAIIWNLPNGQIDTHRKINGRPAMTNTQQTQGPFNGDQHTAQKIADIL